MKAVVILVQALSALSALGAAYFWFRSARIELPVIGSAYGAIANLDAFYAAMKRVATLNRLAATLAGCSALLQAVAIWL